jgi:hypothetical protein
MIVSSLLPSLYVGARESRMNMNDELSTKLDPYTSPL